MSSFHSKFLFKRTNFLFTFFCLLSVNLLLSQNSTNRNSTTTPNILFIIADDLGLDALHSSDYGITLSSQPTTPNIQSLKDDGVSFLNTWATPQCATTRASIISGKYYRIDKIGEKTR